MLSILTILCFIDNDLQYLFDESDKKKNGNTFRSLSPDLCMFVFL